MFGQGRYDNIHGDEDELEQEYKDNKELRDQLTEEDE